MLNFETHLLHLAALAACPGGRSSSESCPSSLRAKPLAKNNRDVTNRLGRLRDVPAKDFSLSLSRRCRSLAETLSSVASPCQEPPAAPQPCGQDRCSVHLREPPDASAGHALRSAGFRVENVVRTLRLLSAQCPVLRLEQPPDVVGVHHLPRVLLNLFARQRSSSAATRSLSPWFVSSSRHVV